MRNLFYTNGPKWCQKNSISFFVNAMAWVWLDKHTSLHNIFENVGILFLGDSVSCGVQGCRHKVSLFSLKLFTLMVF